jgi:pyruvate-ferredoxin/flavodoxin oxidoreductase
MTTGLQNQKAAVQSGQWVLYRFNPDRLKEGLNPLQLDSGAPKMKVEQYLNMENRFKMLTKSKPEAARLLFAKSQTDADVRWRLYESLAARDFKPRNSAPTAAQPAPATVSEHP